MKINLLVQFLALIDELRGREEATAEFERLLTLCGGVSVCLDGAQAEETVPGGTDEGTG